MYHKIRILRLNKLISLTSLRMKRKLFLWVLVEFALDVVKSGLGSVDTGFELSRAF